MHDREYELMDKSSNTSEFGTVLIELLDEIHTSVIEYIIYLKGTLCTMYLPCEFPDEGSIGHEEIIPRINITRLCLCHESGFLSLREKDRTFYSWYRRDSSIGIHFAKIVYYYI